MPVYSVITPVFDGGHQHLHEALKSFQDQEMPAGWTWEWIVQEDGRTGRPLSALPRDDRISYATGARGGAGMARTLGLARSSGDIIRALDADDLLTPGALFRDIQTLAGAREIGWCISSALDLLPDGSLVPGPYDPPAGPLSYADLRAHYEADRFPVVGTHLAVRATLLRALGGWPALPALEALALVLSCAAVAPGQMISSPGGIYRKHEAQTTAQPGYRQEDEFATVRAAILRRLDALALMHWRWMPEKDYS